MTDYASTDQNHATTTRTCAACGTGGSQYQCAGCRRVAYCSADCQTHAWTDTAHASECTASEIAAYIVDTETGETLGTQVPLATTYSEYADALRKARRANRPIVVFFGVGWCRFCRAFKPKFQKLANSRKWQQYGVRTLYVDLGAMGSQPATDLQSKSLAAEIRRYPTVVLFDADGSIEERWDGTPKTAILKQRAVNLARVAMRG